MFYTTARRGNRHWLVHVDMKGRSCVLLFCKPLICIELWGTYQFFVSWTAHLLCNLKSQGCRKNRTHQGNLCSPPSCAIICTNCSTKCWLNIWPRVWAIESKPGLPNSQVKHVSTELSHRAKKAARSIFVVDFQPFRITKVSSHRYYN